jgi:cytochrome c553
MQGLSSFSRLIGLAMGLVFVVVSGRAAAVGDAATGKKKAAVCATCHGPEGAKPILPTYPSLAGQHADYLVRQLTNFKSGGRDNPIMKGQAASLSPNDIQNLAAYFSSIPPRAGSATQPNLVKDGESIYRGGVAKTGVAACMGCHGPSGAGIPPRFPRVGSQLAGYTAQQLHDFKDGKRKSESTIMTDIASRMSDDQIRAVAEYMGGLH